MVSNITLTFIQNKSVKKKKGNITFFKIILGLSSFFWVDIAKTDKKAEQKRDRRRHAAKGLQVGQEPALRHVAYGRLLVPMS